MIYNWGLILFDLTIVISATILSIVFKNGKWMWLLLLLFLSDSPIVYETPMKQEVCYDSCTDSCGYSGDFRGCKKNCFDICWGINETNQLILVEVEE